MRLPQIAVFTRVAPYHGGIHLFSDGTGYFHADYFSGWEAAKLQKVLDECENDSMQSAPDAWCEDHVTFRGAPERQDPGAGPRVPPRVGPRRCRDRQGLAHCFYCLMLLNRSLVTGGSSL